MHRTPNIIFWQSSRTSNVTTRENLKEKKVNVGQLPGKAFLVTLDESSLCTNIPLNQGIDACRHFLNTRDRNASSSSTETLCDFIRMILAINNFSFNDKHYLQTHGTGMGKRMASSYANLFLAKFETDALSRSPFQPFICGGVSS